MASSSLELSLGLKPSYVPKTIDNLLKDLSKVDNVEDRLSVLNDYLRKYHEELSRVEAFKRELPQCMLLLMDAIEILRGEIIQIKRGKEVETERLLTEFITAKRRGYEEEQRIVVEKYGEHKDLMIPPSQNLNPNQDQRQKTALDTTTQNAKGSGLPLDKKTSGTGGLNLRANDRLLNYQPKPLTQPIWKNSRRSWSPELHARFVDALNLLGGIEVATPKQIREIMQVEGLTNNQVKSHLQKYRLHYRRAPGKTDDAVQRQANIQEPWAPEIYYGDLWMSQHPVGRENGSGSSAFDGNTMEHTG